MPTITDPISRKGTTRHRSRRWMRPRCHQAQASKTTGRVNVMPLASVARANTPTAATEQPRRSRLREAGLGGAGQTL